VTIEEMHIAVNLGVQKIGSFQVDNLLPEEIDHELNLAQRRFIKQRYSGTSNQKGTGFEQSQKRIDDLRTLLEDFTAYETFYIGPMYNSASRGIIFVDRVKLPIDYMHLVNIRTKVFHNCFGPVSTVTSEFFDHYLRIPVTTRIDGHVLKTISVPNEGGALLLDVKSNPNGLTIDDIRSDTYAHDIEPSLSPNDTFSDLSSAKRSADSPHADANEIFFKRSTGISGQNMFHRIVGDTKNNGAYAILTYENSAGNKFSRSILQPPTVLATQKRKHAPQIVSGPGLIVKQTLCKYVQHDDIYKVLDDPFSSTKPSAPLYTMQENFVDLYSDPSFIPDKVVIKYLRRPALMRVATGIGSELPEHTHDEIVEMAVKSILEAIQSPRYQSQSGEVLESE